MRSVFVDKVASVAQHSDLGHELRLADEVPCEEGVLLAVKVLNNKTRYNQLELTSAISGSGRWVNKGTSVSAFISIAAFPTTFHSYLPGNAELKLGQVEQDLELIVMC